MLEEIASVVRLYCLVGMQLSTLVNKTEEGNSYPPSTDRYCLSVSMFYIAVTGIMAIKDHLQEAGMIDILNNWDKNNLTHKDVKSEEQRLSNAFEEAVKNGADPKTLAGILNEWKDQHDQLNQMESQLFDGRTSGNEPDVFQQYVHKSKENVAKGMNALTNKTKEFVSQVKEGLMEGGKFLTDKIKNAHQNVMTVFHAKQAELSQKFGKFLDNVKEDIRDKRDFARVERWAKAVDKAEEAKIKLSENKDQRIEKLAEKISGQTKAQLDNNAKKFQKAVESVHQPTFRSRIKAGVKTIADAVQGKEYKEYSADKSSKEAADELKAAKEGLKKADAKAIAVGNMKLGVVKAWTNLTTSFSKFKANQYEKFADLSKSELDKIQSPKVKSYVDQIREAQASGMSLSEAMNRVGRDNNPVKTAATPDKPIKKPDVDLGR